MAKIDSKTRKGFKSMTRLFLIFGTILLLGSTLPTAIAQNPGNTQSSTTAGDSTTAETHYNSAVSLAKDGKTDDAIAECQTAIKLDPNYTIARERLVGLLVVKNRLQEAETQALQWVQLKPNDAHAHLVLGIVYASSKRLAEGRLEWQKTLKMDDVAAATQAQWLLKTNPVLEEINPAFRLTAGELNQAIDKGKQLAQQGKKWDDIFSPVAQMPRGVKGEKGKSHESVVYCTTLNALDLTAAAYKAANNYDPLPPRHSQDGFAKQVRFFVSLQSVPKIGATVFDHSRLAGINDVQVTKFVLTDDKGNVINPVDAASTSGVQGGTMTFSGVNSINHTDTTQSNANANANAYDSNGNSASAYETGTRTTTQTWTEYVPWSATHPYYSATYNVDFPMFDANGNPLITKDVKSITLHIITPNGEKQVTYGLHPPKI